MVHIVWPREHSRASGTFLCGGVDMGDNG
eukprot:SAG31_NODE_50526_length_112_cov_11.769231_1_plen_28_part_01